MNLTDVLKRCMKQTGLDVFYEYHVHLCEARAWIQKGRKGSPPHLIKQRVLRAYARKFQCKVLVETGTYQGEMVNAMKRKFKEIHSIELSRDLFEKASAKFAAYPHVHIYNGDSGDILKNILPKLHQPVLFWLDAHYSAGITAKGDRITPIEAELKHIFEHECADRHVILIDDARTFDGRKDYPTVETIEAKVKQAGYRSFRVEDDIIQIFNPA